MPSKKTKHDLEDVTVYCARDRVTKLTLHTHDLREIHIESTYPRHRHDMMCIGVEEAKKMRDWLDKMIQIEESKRRD